MRQTAYLAAPGYVDELVHELGGPDKVIWIRDRLVLAHGAPRPAAWAHNTWLDPRTLPIASIKDGARKLKAMQRNWALYSTTEHRRAALIEAQLPPVKCEPLVFGTPPPSAPLGSWTLLDRDTMFAAPQCGSPFRHGEPHFVEDKNGPPNRAYLKLWELFTRIGAQPGPGDFCLDLGGSPGGWTWVLQGLGARVLAIDKAPLAPSVLRLPGVEYRRGSAFALDGGALSELGPVDWLFSDVACYPERLLRHVLRWLESGCVRRMVCTLKFQHDTDHAAARAFAAIPGARLMHLWQNKHELTWILAP